MALVTLAYILGVWTAFIVLRQPQRAYEEAVPVPREAANLRKARR